MITITITKTLDDTWAEPGQLDGLSDTEILSLVMEDIVEFVDGACWSVERDQQFCPAVVVHIDGPSETCKFPFGHAGHHSWGKTEVFSLLTSDVRWMQS